MHQHGFAVTRDGCDANSLHKPSGLAPCTVGLCLEARARAHHHHNWPHHIFHPRPPSPAEYSLAKRTPQKIPSPPSPAEYSLAKRTPQKIPSPPGPAEYSFAKSTPQNIPSPLWLRRVFLRQTHRAASPANTLSSSCAVSRPRGQGPSATSSLGRHWRRAVQYNASAVPESGKHGVWDSECGM